MKAYYTYIEGMEWNIILPKNVTSSVYEFILFSYFHVTWMNGIIVLSFIVLISRS